MPRPSKLSPAQWAAIEKRLMAGEVARALGKEFGVSETAIRKRFGGTTSVSLQSLQVRETAEKLAEAHSALEALPPGQRPIAMDLAELLRSTSLSLGRAAELAAKNSHRLQAMANGALQKVDDTQPLDTADSVQALKTVATLTKMANEAAHIPVNLLAANKDRVSKVVDGGEDGETQQHSGVLVVPGLSVSAEEWSANARTRGAKE